MAITAKTLEELGIHESPEDVERMVLDAMRQILAGRPASNPKRSLTPSQRDALQRGGFDLEPGVCRLSSPSHHQPRR